MRTDGHTVKGTEMVIPQAMEWIKRSLTVERIAVAVAKLVVAGYVGIALAHVLQTY